jgi:hypothetical protein
VSSPENPNAFPAPDDGRPSDGYGMTLRDWFAGQALTSIADRPLSHGMSQLAPNSPMHPDKAAAAAYRYADAMLAERNKAAVKPPLEAAAPDMLEALRDLIPMGDPSNSDDLPDDLIVLVGVTIAELRAARKAIAAATGEV